MAEILTSHEVTRLEAMEALLGEIGKRLEKQAWREGETHVVYSYGRMASVLEEARSCLFTVINTAAHALDCDVSGAALDIRFAVDEPVEAVS